MLHHSGLVDIVAETPTLDIATRLQRIADVPRAIAGSHRDPRPTWPAGPRVQVELGDELHRLIVKAKPVGVEKVDAAKMDVAKVKFDAGRFDVAKVLIDKDAVGKKALGAKAFDKNAALKRIKLNPFALKFNGLGRVGGFAAGAQIAAERRPTYPCHRARMSSAPGRWCCPHTSSQPSKTWAAAAPEAGAEAIDLKKVRIVDAAEGFTLGTQLLGAPGSLVAAADGGLRGLTVAAAEGIKELVLADAGDLLPSVDAQLGALDAADSALVKAEVSRLVANRVPPRNGPLIPDTITNFSFDTAAAMVEELTPVRTYAKLLKFANVFEPGAVSRREASAEYPEQLFPAMAAPLIQTPLATRLEKMDPDWLLGGLGKLPNNSICLMEINRQFVEALLVGANHEFGRELLWRGHPTDLRGTCFPRFWDGPEAVGIKPISTWTGDLGTHSAGDVDIDLVVVVIKGDLLRRYPNTLISAEKGVTSPIGAPTDFTSDGQVAKEWFRGFIGSDVTYSVLGISHEVLLQTDGDDDRHGWYIPAGTLRRIAVRPRRG